MKVYNECIKRNIPRGQKWTRHIHSTPHLTSRPITLKPSPKEHVNLEAFREQAFIPKKPFLFRKEAGSPTTNLPATNKWFASDGGSWSLAPYMKQFQEWLFPYELLLPSASKQEAWVSFQNWLSSSGDELDQVLVNIIKPSMSELESHTFFQLHGPLHLLIKALEFNRQNASQPSKLLELYIAQSSLPDLPQPLLDDVPTPELVLKAGKGDVYNSSIWLGTEPTYTPLHRDPNPNIFSQLCNHKLIRLMPPSTGDRLFYQVQGRIRQHSNSRIRTSSMMEGKEREVLHEVVWETDSPPEAMVEAELGPGDALFIPNGWWHSVKSKGSSGQLNGSVNWWFR